MVSRIIQEDIRTIAQDLGSLTAAFNNTAVLITGGAGFLGKYLVLILQYLNKFVLEKPCRIIVLDNFITGLKGIIEEDENTSVIEQDISKPVNIEGGVDFIFHAASIAAPLFYSKFPLETIDVGFLGTKNLLELARVKNVKSFLFFSTSEVYGNPDSKFIPTPETYNGNVSCIGPRAAYDEPKRIGETLCMTYSLNFGIPVKIVRPFNIYGPGMRLDDGRGAINFVVAALKGEKIPVYGDGRNTRTWCYVTDAITGFFQVLLSKYNREVFNIGSDEQEIEMRHLAEIVSGLVKNENSVVHQVVGPNEAYSKADVSRRCPDLTKIRTVIGYFPKVGLVKGLQRFIRWTEEALKEQENYGFQKKCRICGSDSLRNVISLGNTPLANALLSENELHRKEESFPLELMFCEKCFLCQLSYVVAPEKMFSNYLYVSSTTETFRRHFSEMADSVSGFLGLNDKSLVVDIGSNDGFLLKKFKEKRIRVVGVEPASNICEISRSNGVETFCGFFNDDIVNSICSLQGKADVITANNVFAHIGNIKEVARNVKNLLKDNGVLIIEVQYLLDTVLRLSFDNIYHEHLSYFCVLSLQEFFKRQDMNVFMVEHVDTHGGSLRVFVQKAGFYPQHSSVDEFIMKERHAGLDKFSTFEEFARKLMEMKRHVKGFFDAVKNDGKKIVGYGAPAKATTFLNFYGITNDDIAYIVEDNPLKHGKTVPGVRIPVRNKESWKSELPEYAFVLAWNFADEIIRNNEEYRSKGLQFVIPAPEWRIV
ncbi:NAD-dependent epimerase/dehydratase family protein [Candidatus Woesearchaeota archaeon]|nr:NAD-dependent epimerase/dehydratase family protein [Candidatus Woesearchaeota archaeon]